MTITRFGAGAFNSAGEITKNTIILPDLLNSQADKLCNEENECIGWVICNKSFSGDHILLTAEYLYVANTGSETSVFHNPFFRAKHIKILQLDSQKYEAIEFHTHPRKLSEYWQENFSNQDIQSIKARIETNRHYKHLLFTARHILLYSNTEFDLRISKLSPEAVGDYLQTKQQWGREYNPKAAKF